MRQHVLIIALLTGWLSACERDNSAGPKPATGGAPSAIPVVVSPVEQRVIFDRIEAVGTAQANESITVTAKVTDTVSGVRFGDGDMVKSGDVLVELTSAEQQALLNEAKANLDDADVQLKRLEDLLVQRSVPVSQVDEARARYNGAKARYESVLARLDDRLITAPFSGVLGFRQVSTGTLVAPGTAITTLDDVSIIKLDFSVPEVYLGALSQGLELVASSVAFPGDLFAAEVQTIDTRVDPVTRAATVRALITNESLKLRPGMLMVVQLTINERRALLVPEIALIQQQDKSFVYVVDEALVATRQAVELGGRYDGWAEILSGLQAEQLVVTEGIIKLRPNVPVVIQNHPEQIGPVPSLGAD